MEFVQAQRTTRKSASRNCERTILGLGDVNDEEVDASVRLRCYVIAAQSGAGAPRVSKELTPAKTGIESNARRCSEEKIVIGKS